MIMIFICVKRPKCAMTQQKQKVRSNSLNTFVVRSLSTEKSEKGTRIPTFLLFCSFYRIYPKSTNQRPYRAIISKYEDIHRTQSLNSVLILHNFGYQPSFSQFQVKNVLVNPIQLCQNAQLRNKDGDEGNCWPVRKQVTSNRLNSVGVTRARQKRDRAHFFLFMYLFFSFFLTKIDKPAIHTVTGQFHFISR